MSPPLITCRNLAVEHGALTLGIGRRVEREAQVELDRSFVPQVESQTQPLGSSLQTVNAALVQISGGLMVLLQYLQNADSSLGRVADKLAARRGTR